MYPYMNQISSIEGTIETETDIRDTHKLCEILRTALSYQLLALSKTLNEKNEHSFETKWNSIHQVDISKTARLHAIYLTSLSLSNWVSKLGADAKTQGVMSDICKVFITDVTLKYADSALLNGYINSSQLVNIQKYNDELIEGLKPHVIALIESQVVHEAVIHGTTLSGMDEDYASKLYQQAQYSKLNNTHTLDAIDEHLKPLSAKLTNFAKI